MLYEMTQLEHMDETLVSASNLLKQISLAQDMKKMKFLKLLSRQRRLIFKSPNPNDERRIVLGNRELEADTLLNGASYPQRTKEHPIKLDYSRQERRFVKTAGFVRQRRLSANTKSFSLSGRHIEAGR